jgi:hypothetical protein
MQYSGRDFIRALHEARATRNRFILGGRARPEMPEWECAWPRFGPQRPSLFQANTQTPRIHECLVFFAVRSRRGHRHAWLRSRMSMHENVTDAICPASVIAGGLRYWSSYVAKLDLREMAGWKLRVAGRLPLGFACNASQTGSMPCPQERNFRESRCMSRYLAPWLRG